MDGQILDQVSVNGDLRGFELMLEQRESITNDLVEVGFAELCGGGAREIQQAVGDFGCAKTLLRDLFEHGAEPGIAAHLFGQHLCVGRDNCEGRVDFVRDTGSEQTDGTEFVSFGRADFRARRVL